MNENFVFSDLLSYFKITGIEILLFLPLGICLINFSLKVAKKEGSLSFYWVLIMNDLKKKSFKLIIKTAVSKTDENAILLNLNSGSYYELNDVAHLIVQNLNDFIGFNKIKEIIIENFDIEEDRCEKDILSFLQDLIERDFLEVL